MKKIFFVLIIGFFFIPFVSAINNIGDYTGDSFDTAGSGSTNPRGITQNGTFIWIVDSSPDEAYKFYLNGTYTGDSFDTAGSGNANPWGITQNGTFIWINDNGLDEVFKYNMDGTYTGDSFDTAGSGNANPRGMTQNGTFIWINDALDGFVFKYNMDGTYTGDSFNLSEQGLTQVAGITQNGTFFWSLDNNIDNVYKYYMNGTYTGDSFNTNPPSGTSQGITSNDDFFWSMDSTQDEVFKYIGPDGDLIPPTINLISPINYTNITSQENKNFIANWTDTQYFAGNLTLHIWDSSGNLINNLSANTSSVDIINNETTLTYLFSIDDTYYWNFEGCDDGGNCNFSAQGNYSLIVDTPSPNITIDNILTTAGSQTFLFNSTAVDSNLDSCWYDVQNSTGLTDPAITVNTSFTCNTNNIQDTVSDFGTYTLFVYANDTAGNENSTNQSFTISTAPAPAAGGGGGGGIIATLPALALIVHPNDTIVYSDLDRAKMFRAIFEYCGNNTENPVCSRAESQINLLIEETHERYGLFIIDEINILLWIDQYEEKEVETIEISKTSATQFDLITAEAVVIKDPFGVRSELKDRFFFAFFSNKAEYNILPNRELKSCEIVSGDMGFSCEVDVSGTFATIIYEIPENAVYTFNNVQAILSLTDINGDVTFVDPNLRIIRGTPQLFIGVGIVLAISLLIFLRRKEAEKIWKKFLKNLKIT